MYYIHSKAITMLMGTFAVTFTCHASKHINKKTAPTFGVLPLTCIVK